MSTIKKGQITLLAIVVMIIASLFSLNALSMFLKSAHAGGNYVAGLQALSLAESGLRYTYENRLYLNDNWSNVQNYSMSLGNGHFDAVFTSKTPDTCTLKVTGIVNGTNVSRSVQISFDRVVTQPVAFNFALYKGQYTGKHCFLGGSNNSSTSFDDRNNSGNMCINDHVVVIGHTNLAGGTIYYPTYCGNVEWKRRIIFGPGKGNYKSATIDPFPPMPPLNNSSYVATIKKINDITLPAGGLSNLNTSRNITLSGEVISFEAITISSGQTLNVSGFGTIIVRKYINLYGNVNIRPSSGETIAISSRDVYTEGYGFNVRPYDGHVARFEPGTILFAKKSELILNSDQDGWIIASGTLLMSNRRVTAAQDRTYLTNQSIIYIPTNATGSSRACPGYDVIVDYSKTSNKYGLSSCSIIVDCDKADRWVRFWSSAMAGVIYCPKNNLRLWADSVVQGSIVTNRIFGDPTAGDGENENSVVGQINYDVNVIPRIIKGITLVSLGQVKNSWKPSY